MIEPLQIIEESATRVSIKWSDDTETAYSAAVLRRSCPCASCVNEWTGQKILNDDQIDDDMSFTHISIVGRYALNFHFSDSHDTGIFSFDYLRKLSDGSD